MSHIAMIGETSINLDNLNLKILAHNQEPKFSGKGSLGDHPIFKKLLQSSNFQLKTFLETNFAMK